MSEIWKDVKGFEGLYQVSNQGRVKSLDRLVRTKGGKNRFSKGKILTQQTDRGGYSTVYFSTSGKGRHMKVHRLVCEAFCEKLSGENIVNHKDGNRSNNAADNLEWCNSKYNINHAIKSGSFPTGEQARDSILSEKEVLAIRTDTSRSYERLAELYGVSKSTIADIKKFRSWKTIGGDRLLSVGVPKKVFGERLRALREARGLTRQELADDLEVSRSAVGRWEQGSSLPLNGPLKKLVEKYEVELH